MPLYTNARQYDRYSNVRIRGFNGYAGTVSKINIVEYSGVLLNDETAVPLPTGATISYTTVPFPERISASARYGERINYTVALVGANETFTISTTNDLGTVKMHCGHEFSWNVSLSFEGPVTCAVAGTRVRVNGVSGSLTKYGTATEPPTQTFDFYPLTEPEVAVSEEGTDYSETEGERVYKTWEVMAVEGVPWSEWQEVI